LNNLEILENSLQYQFTEDDKEAIFLIWYQAGKPGVHRLRKILLDSENFPQSRVPSWATLDRWIRNAFQKRAEILDNKVREELENKAILEKVEMLSRHTKIAREMQAKALEIIRDSDLSGPQAVRLLIESIRIESESVGVPQAIQKMLNKTTEELIDDLNRLLSKGTLDISPIDEEE